MFRAMTWTLRQRRYRALAIAMLILAIGCVGAGTFELHRYHEKTQGNRALKANAAAAVMPLGTVLAGTRTALGDAVKYRSVRVTGRFDVDGQTYLGNQTQGGHEGFFVLTPLRTTTGTLLVARGFVAARSDSTRPANIAAPPTATVSIVGRLYPTQTGDDQLGVLGHGEITAVNADDQAARLGTPVYQAWLTLDADQPGTSRLDAVPGPPRSNPTGGASEWQLLSYVVQWYVFAILALLAPFFFARAEARDAQRRFLGVDPDEIQIDAVPIGAARPQLAGSESGDSTALVRRPRAGVATSQPVSPRLAQAQRLADRYGRSLGPDPAPVTNDAPQQWRDAERESVPRSSKDAPHRSGDTYHGSYNDYLWQLALADGEAPDVALPGDESRTRSRGRSVTEHGPRVIDRPRVIDVPADEATPPSDPMSPPTDADDTADAER